LSPLGGPCRLGRLPQTDSQRHGNGQ
jgi:hypothetical protein